LQADAGARVDVGYDGSHQESSRPERSNVVGVHGWIARD
jgi:hypothetical protein